ncbi:DUF3662 and FHA domain-containing protein [Corynebacterium lizhenjunii]|uniref:DUF3662 and FHA domain-containing protein n=1 Tax=Corynebacterium lizhenjunii TaxID=2709394 RepID=UPI0013ED9399|nr:DUF3662 and FHA domain-containing protein [Corynebacterium lizhenjunii]
MGVFARLAKLDSAMQRGLDNGMAFVFGGRVVPAEIEELIKQEAHDNLTRGEDNNLYAPNVITVAVSAKDIENLSQDPQLPDSLADQIARYVRNNGWHLAGPVIVRIAEESGLRTGQLRVSSFIDHEPEEENGFDAIFHTPYPEENQAAHQPADKQAGHYPAGNQAAHEPADNQLAHAAAANAGAAQQDQEDSDTMNNFHVHPGVEDAATTAFRAPTVPEGAGDGPSVNLLLQDGSSRTYQVREGSNIIGRSNEADLRLPDTGVSRQHAEITWNGHDAVLVDLQSTNGTTVNDTPIENWLLADGDVITMGHSHIEVRITGLDT